MKLAKVFAWLGVIAMTVILIYGFTAGNFSSDGSMIISNPWGKVSLVDLYVGFSLFALWIVFRERHPVVSIVWVVLLMVLGFFTGALYILINLYQSNGDWLEFFLGNQKQSLLDNQRK